jgi:hypothetical protein
MSSAVVSAPDLVTDSDHYRHPAKHKTKLPIRSSASPISWSTALISATSEKRLALHSAERPLITDKSRALSWSSISPRKTGSRNYPRNAPSLSYRLHPTTQSRWKLPTAHTSSPSHTAGSFKAQPSLPARSYATTSAACATLSHLYNAGAVPANFHHPLATGARMHLGYVMAERDYVRSPASWTCRQRNPKPGPRIASSAMYGCQRGHHRGVAGPL